MEAGSPPVVTARAAGLSLLAALGIGLLSAYNDCHLNNTYFIGNHFPVAAIALVAVLIVTVNVGARRVFGIRGLSPAELLLIWAAVGVAGSLSSYSIAGYFPSFVVAPAYYAHGSADYADFVLAHLPGWMVVSRDPDHPALRWFMEGLPRGERIPWGAWGPPLATWGAFAALLYGSNIALCALFYRQWSVRERLIFPLVQVPAEMARAARAGTFANEFFRNRLTWAGIALPVVAWGLRGVHAYVPAVPSLTLSWNMWSIFADRPWSEFRLMNAEVFFSVIGVTFLLTREMGFSFWAFFILYRLSYVWVAWLGAGGQGYFGNWWTRVAVFETAGGMLTIAAFLVWTARRPLAAWLRRVRAGTSDAEEDLLPPRLGFLLIAGGFAAMTGWYVLAGAQWWVGAIAVLVFAAMMLVNARVVAEAGLMFLGGITEPFRFVTGLFPAAWVSGPSLVALALQRGIITEDMRKILIPYVINGMRAGETGGLRLRPVTGILAAAAVIGLACGTYGFIATSYKHGATNVDFWASTMAPRYYLDDAVARQRNPPDFNMITAGDTAVVPVNLAHLLTGAGLTGGLLALRTFLPWWPLHPFGFLFCATWAISRIWFSLFLGWMAKTAVMTFAGAKAYRTVLPLFLGMALGECLIAVFWMILGLVTGIPNEQMVP